MTDPYLVEPDWLAQNLDAAGLVILDVSWFVPEAGKSGREEFEKVHIANARYLDLNDISDMASPYVNMLPSAEQFARMIGGLGISNETQVIIYDGSYVSARVWWMFRLFGHDKVAILNGGFRRWQAEGYPVASGPATDAVPATFVASAPAEQVASWQTVLDAIHAGDHAILDARTPGRFTGEMSSGYPGVAGGHMPTAVNVSWVDLIEQSGQFRFIGAEEARQVFETAGVDLQKPVIATCGSGVTACIIAFQLERLGKDDWQVYDGSWHEWGQRNDLPKESI
jgi:thiosulfate/3-mercaptopyruvate sulfurtransferase